MYSKKHRLTMRVKIKRWANVLTYSFIGSLLLAYLSLPLGGLLLRLEEFLFGNTESVGAFVVFGILGIVLLLLVYSYVGVSWCHWKHLISYPPLTVSVFIAIVVAPVWTSSDGGWLQNSLMLKDAVWISGCFLFSLLVWEWRLLYESIKVLFARRKDGNNTAESVVGESGRKKLTDLSDDELLEWIEREDPIEDEKNDLFGHSQIAQRMLDRLLGGSGGRGVSIALQGDFGSGKSSICNLVQRRAEKQSTNLIFVRSSCWGYEDAKEAKQEILSAIVREVEKHVDCLAIQGLPAKYIRALEGHISWLDTIVRLGASNPLEQLQKLSPVLQAIGKRLVIVIEDVDRSGETFDISQIQAMLMQFREVDCVSFILAIGPSQRVDFLKMCEHLEMVLNLRDEDILNVGQRIVEIVQKKWPSEVPVGEIHLFKSSPYIFFGGSTALANSFPVSRAITRLLSKPRLLSHALRDFVEKWKVLRGEININDLFAICCLIKGAPEAFMFFSSRFKFFDSAIHRNDSTKNIEDNPILSEVRKEWDVLLSSNAWDGRAVASLFHLLYNDSVNITGVKEHCSSNIREGDRFSRLQSMNLRNRRDVYATRLFTGNISLGDISDKRVFSLICRSRVDLHSLEEMAHILLDHDDAACAYENFIEITGGGLEEQLFAEILRIRRENNFYQNIRYDERILMILWNRLRAKYDVSIRELLSNEAAKCMPGYIHMLNYINHEWIHLLLERYASEEIGIMREKTCDRLKKIWGKISPDELALGFEASFPYVLCHLAYTTYIPREGLRGPMPLSDAKDWAWSAEYLLKAAEAKPDIILPQVCNVLNKESMSRNPVYDIDEQKLTDWFGVHARGILSLIAGGFTLHPDMEENSRQYLEHAPDVAKRMLKEKGWV